MGIGLTLSGLRDQLRAFIDDRNSDRFTNAELLPLLNEGQRFVQSIIDQADERYFTKCFACSVVPTDDAIEFTLPDDLKKVVSAERENDAYPVSAEWVDFSKRQSLPSLARLMPGLAPVSPTCYMRGTKIGVVNPTDTYTLHVWYTYAIPDLAGDGDYSEIPAEHRLLVALHAAKLTKGESEDDRLPPELQQAYDAMVAAIPNSIETRQRQAPRGVQYVEEY